MTHGFRCQPESAALQNLGRMPDELRRHIVELKLSHRAAQRRPRCDELGSVRHDGIRQDGIGLAKPLKQVICCVGQQSLQTMKVMHYHQQ